MSRNKKEFFFKRLTKGLFARYRLNTNPNSIEFGKRVFCGNATRHMMLVDLGLKKDMSAEDIFAYHFDKVGA